MNDQTSNRNDAANRMFHIPFEDVVAMIIGLTPFMIAFYLLKVN